MDQGEFTKIGRRRTPQPVISEFKVKISNKFDLLSEDEKSEISDEVEADQKGEDLSQLKVRDVQI